MQQIINVGAAANDGLGDPLRDAYIKCNNNFTELYLTNGSVTSVSVVPANGITGSVTNPTTTPAITLSLGNINPTTVNTIQFIGASTPKLTVIGTSGIEGNNTGDVTLAGTGSYLSLSNQVITQSPIGLASSNVTGTLAVGNGGTGVTSSTGSGSNVLSTNPVLTTPNIGTPSAGVLTNCTGLPLSTGVTGDLPYSSLTPATGASLLLGRGSAAGAGDWQEITLGTNLTMTGTVLSASGGSGGGNVSGPASPITDNALVRWDLNNTQIQNSNVTLSDTNEMAGVKSLEFNTAGGTFGLARLTWDTTNQTLDLGIGAGSVNALLGVDSHVLGRNTTGSLITRGQVVRVNGASSGNLTIALAQGNTDPNTANTIGIAAENIANNATGMVITSGLLRDLNTNTFSNGDLLFISATTAGLLVNTAPSAPNHAVRMGYVVSAHPSNGIIYVAVNNGYELNELHDVNYPTTPATNDFLVYVTNRWENQAPTTARTSLGLGSVATLNSISLTANVSGTLPVANGGTGVTTSTGSGSVVLSTSPTLTTPALGTPTSGTLTSCTGLPISTGVSGLGTGVATFLATPTSSNLAAAVTDETGTGSLVLATSPTLVTPILGTPTSGTLTNCTGLPISSGVSGLGTGVATFLATPTSANLAAAVTDETGTGSLVLATSPTLVTPALGTPSSGTLTSCTGLPLSTGVTGNLPLANLAQASAASKLLGRGSASGAGNFEEITLGSGLTMSGTTLSASGGGSGGGSTNVWIPAAQMIPRTTNGAGINTLEASTNKVNYDVLEFDPSTAEYAQFAIVLPNNWSGTTQTITIKFHWTAASGSGSVVWGAQARSYPDNSALDQASGTAQTVTDTLLTVAYEHISAATSAITIGGTPANGNLIIAQVYRDAANASDTLGSDAQLLGVEISYTAA